MYGEELLSNILIGDRSVVIEVTVFELGPQLLVISFIFAGGPNNLI